MSKPRMSKSKWKLRCRRSARRCGAKHISKSKCAKHTSVGALLQVVMSKKCAPLWREAHFQVKARKTRQLRSIFGSWDVDKVRTVVARSISKSKCAKHASVGACLEVGMSTKCAPLWREAHFQVKVCKARQRRSTLGSWDVDKVRTWREAFPSQNARSTPASEHVWKLGCRQSACRCGAKHFQVIVPKTHQRRSNFWKLGCRQSACSCGAKHISKSKPAKHTSIGAHLEVGMPTKCTLLRREAHVQVKMHKAPLHSTTLLSITLHDAPLHYTPLHYTPLRYTTLHQVHCMTLHYTTLDHTTHHYTPLHYNTLHATSLHYTALHYATPHSTTLHYTNCITLHCVPFHYFTLHYTNHNCSYNYKYCYVTLRNTRLHCTTLHYSTPQSLHYHNANYTTTTTTPLRYQYNAAALHHTASSSCG